MSLTAGSVTVTGLDGSNNPVFGVHTGMSAAVYDGLVAQFTAPTVPGVGVTTAPYSAGRPSTAQDVTNAKASRLTHFQNLAKIGTGVGALATYITSNAVVSPGTLVAHVSTESLGKTPNPNNPNTAILAPAAPVDVPLNGTGTVS